MEIIFEAIRPFTNFLLPQFQIPRAELFARRSSTNINPDFSAMAMYYFLYAATPGIVLIGCDWMEILTLWQNYCFRC